MVGTTGFEPATPTTPRWYATKLRYVPLLYLIVKFWRSLVFFIIRLHRTFGSPFACPTRNCPPDTSSQGTCYVPLLYLIVKFWRSLVFFIIRLHRTFGSPFACPTRNCPPDTSSQGTCYVPRGKYYSFL